MSIDLVAFQLKGGLFTLTTLQIFTADIEAVKEQLLAKVQQAPNFFHHAPIVLDLRIANQPNSTLDFARLKATLEELKLIPVGIRNATQEQMQAAIRSGLAILRDTPDPREKERLSTAAQIAPKTITSKIITTPVRSGQQIYAPDGDLIIINQVSHGAELIADGNIHVYGALRGRALAGINGNQKARIFCQSLEAELVSVAGSYKISEDIERHAWKIAAQIHIKDDRLQITTL
ncbi:MAG TPA: septum site-determining protein MinC [Gammaproteobacteria bacterium]|nr:septum site-determining protein MinC [Gammaproteobacteria bacterium]